MKNLLIDALRQAGDREEAPRPDGPVAEQPEGEPVSGGAAAEHNDLQLAETTVLAGSMKPAAIAVDGPVAPAAADEAVDDPTMLVPSLSLSEVPVQDPGKRAIVPPWLQSMRLPAEHPLNRDLPILLGRWSPVLCLAALSASAAVYSGYQKMAAQAMNPDLGTLPAPLDQRVENPSPDGLWDAFFDRGESNAETLPMSPAEVAPITPGVIAEPADEGRTAVAPQATRTAVLPRVERTGGSRIENPAYADVQAGFHAYANGDYGHAERLYRAALATDPNDGQALAGLAAVLQRTARADQSIPVYERMLVLDPLDVSASASLLAHAKSGAPADDETRVKLLIQRHPEAAALHFTMGLMMAKQSRWAEAHQAFLKANSLVPDNADYSYNVAVTAERLGRIEIARTYYEATLAMKDGSWLFDRQAVSRQLALLSAEPGDSS